MAMSKLQLWIEYSFQTPCAQAVTEVNILIIEVEVGVHASNRIKPASTDQHDAPNTQSTGVVDQTWHPASCASDRSGAATANDLRRGRD